MDSVKEMMKQHTNRSDFRDKYQQIIKKVMADEDIKQFIFLHEDEITQDILEKSYAKFHEFIKERDARINGKPVSSPGLEPVLQMNVGFVDVIYRPTAEFMRQQKEKSIKRRLHALNMPKNIAEATFAEVDITEQRAMIVAEAVELTELMTKEPKTFHQGLYLSGTFGVGKTFLLGAMANELAKNGFITTLLHVPSFSMEMKQAIGTGDVGEKIDIIKKADILMLDDIGAESSSVWFRDEVLGVILQYRMLQELPTFFSSNFTMAELEEHFRVSQRGDDEPLKAKRLMERVKFLAHEIEVTGENRRPK